MAVALSRQLAPPPAANTSVQPAKLCVVDGNSPSWLVEFNQFSYRVIVLGTSTKWLVAEMAGHCAKEASQPGYVNGRAAPMHRSQ